MPRQSCQTRRLAVLLAAALAAATVVTTASVASAAPPGANMEGTGPQPKGQGLGSKAALAQDSCDSATGRTNFEVVGGGPWCVNPWPEGKDNGGATATGVTADTVKVIVYVPNEQMIAKQGSTSPPKNRATGEPASYEDVIRDYAKVYDYAQANLHTYQTWGRTPEFEFVTASGDDEASQRADAVAVLAKKPFIVVDEGNVTTGSPVFAAAVAAGKTIVVSSSTNAESATKQRPYRWGVQDPDASSYLVASFLGRSLNGEKAQWAGDKGLQSKPRAFGVVHPATEFDVDAFKQRMKDNKVSASEYIAYDSSDSAKAEEQAPTIIAKFKSSGVTTVVLFANAPMMTALMKVATTQQYSPEWIITGFAFHDWDGFGRGADQSQMAHAFGTGVLPPLYEGSGLNNYFNWYWGPNQGNSAEGLAYVAQPVYEMLHYAGPTLTAANVEKGRFSAPAIGGASDGTTYFQTGFGKTVKLPYDEHDSLGTDRNLAWWNPDITGGTNAVGTLVGKGKLMYLDGGKRYAYGEFPTKEPKFFDTSVSAATIPLSSRYVNGVVPTASACTGCPSNGGTSTA